MELKKDTVYVTYNGTTIELRERDWNFMFNNWDYDNLIDYLEAISGNFKF